MSNQSLPVTQPQPADPTYSVHTLELFKSYMDRAAYQAAFGEQDPPFDPTLPIKNWRDDSYATADPETLVTYKYWALAGSVVVQKTLTMKASQARTVNLTGAFHYPEYVVARTGATQGGSPVDPYELSTKEQAVALATLFNRQADSVIEPLEQQPFPIVYPAEELRRAYYIQLSADIMQSVGKSLKAQNQYGVGAPGNWAPAASGPSGGMVWAPLFGPTGEGGMYPYCPVPMRDLLPNEQFVVGGSLFSGVGFVVTRTDLAPVGSAPGVGGGFTPAQVTKLLADIVHIRTQVDVIAIEAVRAA